MINVFPHSVPNVLENIYISVDSKNISIRYIFLFWKERIKWNQPQSLGDIGIR